MAIGINQDALGKGAQRIDSNSTAMLVAKESEQDPRSRYTAMKVQECGGEPDQQKWVFSKTGLLAGTVSNQGNVCLNIEGTYITHL